MILVFTLTLLLIFHVAEVSSLYFLVKPQVRCYTLDLPKDTPMVFNYEIMDEEHSIGCNMYYGSEANNDMRILGKKIHKTGHIDFVADNEGAYSICLSQTNVYEFPTVMTLLILSVFI